MNAIVGVSLLMTGLSAMAEILPPVAQAKFGYFEKNIGQLPSNIIFVARTPNRNVYITATDIIAGSASGSQDDEIRITFARDATHAVAEGLEPLAAQANYIRPSASFLHVPLSQRAAVREALPGIDVLFKIVPSGLEYDFVIRSGADPARILMLPNRNTRVRITPKGDVEYESRGGFRLTQMSPTIYQLDDRGAHHPVSGHYVRVGAGIGLRVGGYDKHVPLIIDPILNYSTFLANIDVVNGIHVDSVGNTYITGGTSSLHVATTPGVLGPTIHIDPNLDPNISPIPSDAYVMKFNRAGTLLLATYLGGTSADSGYAITADDKTGEIYVAGDTYPSGSGTARAILFPVTGYHPTSYPGQPYVFVAKLTADASALTYSAIIGGGFQQHVSAIALDGSGRAIIAGWTTNFDPTPAHPTTFPTTAGAFQTHRPNRSLYGIYLTPKIGYVTKIAPDGASLSFSTFLGGSWEDQPASLATDSSGNIWIAGQTTSANYWVTTPTYGAHYVGTVTHPGTGLETRQPNGFVSELNATGTTLRYSTFIPSTRSSAAAVAVDSEDNAYVTGSAGADLPTLGTGLWHAPSPGGGFLAQISKPGATQPIATQYVMFTGQGTPLAIAVNGAAVYIAGTTDGSLPLQSAYQQVYGGNNDGFLMRFNTLGSVLEYSTYLGGSAFDRVDYLGLDRSGNAYLAGHTESDNFPVTAGAMTTTRGFATNFYTQFNFDQDGDGLLDVWETNGIDVDGDGVVDLNLAAFGATPDHKDVFVEADYMAAPDHTHNPLSRPDGTSLPASPLQAVIDAFANAPVTNPDGHNGIRLHVLVDEALTELNPMSFGVPNSDFTHIKNGTPPATACTGGHFGTVADRANSNCTNILKAKRLVYRYCVFAHDFTDPQNAPVGGSGTSELGGDDFTVTLRVHAAQGLYDWAVNANVVATRFGTSFDAEWSDFIAGTFMHELGHTLGLQHGGSRGITNFTSRGINCKPNYLSVMSYSRQLNNVGKDVANPQTLIRIQRALDYSRTVQPLLDETALNESNGTSGPVGALTTFGVNGIAYVAPVNGAIDWNRQNGIESGPVAADINYLATHPGCDPSPGELLDGSDDWNNLIYSFRGSKDFANGVGTSTDLPPEENAEQASGAMLGTIPPQVTLTSPSSPQYVAAGTIIALSATAADPDGSVANVVFEDNAQTLLGTATAAPYTSSWTANVVGTHYIAAQATDNLGAVGLSPSVIINVGCSAAPVPASLNFPSGGGSPQQVQLTLPSTCQWSATTTASWLSVTTTAAAGNGTITVAADRNYSATARSATLTIGNASLVVSQDAAPPFGVPTNLAASGQYVDGSACAHVTWTGVGDADHYDIAVSYDGSTFTVAGSVQDEAFDWSGAIPSFADYVEVRAVTASGTTSAYATAVLVCFTPQITQQPANTTVYAGDQAQVSVTANVSTFLWYVGATGDTSHPIVGAHDYFINVTPLVTTSYWVRALSWCNLPADSDTVTVTVLPQPNSFYTLVPCRPIDTRGGGAVASGGVRNFTLAGVCGIPPSGVIALSVNVTAIGGSGMSPGSLTLFPGPSGASIPTANTVSYGTKVVAAAAIVMLNSDGTVNMYNTGPNAVDFLLDVNGYFK